jgi:hypothetical protein
MYKKLPAQQWPRLSYNENKTTIEGEPELTGATGDSNEERK